MPCSTPDDYPIELWDTTPPTVYEISLSDCLYRAIACDHVERDSRGAYASAAAFSVGEPQLSVNCSALSKPEHCAFPASARQGFGAAEIAVKNIEQITISQPGVETEILLKVHHDPEPCNRSHSIIGIYKRAAESTAKGTEHKISSRGLRLAVRMFLSEQSRIVLDPTHWITRPPQNGLEF